MEITAIVNRKGGVGKTAAAQTLGAGLIKKGFSVLFIDLDSQTNLTYSIGAKSNKLNSMDVLTGEATAKEAIQHTKNGDIIPGSEYLAGADLVINGKGKEYRLKEAIKGLNYDYIIIDTPAALGTLTINALTAATNAIIPVQAEIYSLQGIGLLARTIDAIKEHSNPDLYIKGVLLTRNNSRTVLTKDMQSNLQEITKQLKTTLYKVPIRECVSVKEAQAEQIDIFTYAPRSNAAQDYKYFIDEYMERTKKKK